MLINLESVPSFYKGYVKSLQTNDVMQALRMSHYQLMQWVHTMPEGHENFAYAEGKWTVREVLGHCMDAERIFAYRALRFARHDQTPLEGFDENSYAEHAKSAIRPIAKIAQEMTHLRASTLDLFDSFTPDMMEQKGTASQQPMTVRLLGLIIAGHETHHRHVLEERYRPQ